MKRLWFIAVVCLAVPLNYAWAQNKGVEVLSAEGSMFDSEPGKIVTISFRVSNRMQERKEFVPELLLPKGWKPVSGDFSFTLDADASDVLVVSFVVSALAQAGTEIVTYRVSEKGRPDVSDAAEISVLVLAKTKIETRLVRAPLIVVAGEEYTCVFSVSNRGNKTIQLAVTVKSLDEMPVALNKDAVELKPSESDTVEATVKTDKNTSQGYIHRLQLSVFDPQNKGVQSSTMSAVEVIPRVSGKTKRYQEIPARVKLSFVGEDNDQKKSGFQTDFSAAGTLDDAQTQHVAVHVRTPDTQDKSSYGLQDEYNVEYRTDDYAVYAGDRVYSLSSLTESGLYSSGLEARVRRDNFVMGAYNTAVRLAEPQNEETAAYLDYYFDKEQNVGLNYMNKRFDGADSDVLSVNSEVSPGAGNNLELEYARGMQQQVQDNAYLLKFSTYQRWMSGNVRFIRADPDFTGTYQDQQYISGDFGFPINRKLRLNMGYYETRNNLDQDPRISTAAQVEDYYKLGLSYHVFRPLSLMIDYQRRNRVDTLGVADYDFQEDTLRFGASSSFDRLSVSGFGELGSGRDNVAHEDYEPVKYSLNTSFSLTDKQRYSTYVQYTDDGKTQGQTNDVVTVGARADYRLAKRTRLNFDFQSSYNRNPHVADQDDFALHLEHELYNANKVSLRAKRIAYRKSNQRAENSYMAEYAMALGVPIGLNKKAGSLKGSIYDDITKKVVPGVILRLNDLATLTDKKGLFAFNGLKPSQYFLNVNTAELGTNIITIPKAPFKVDVEGGKDTLIQLRLTEAALISGRILAFNPQDEYRGIMMDPDEDRVLKAHGVPDVRVELNNGMEVRHTMTDERGYFEFQEVYPGKSVVTVSVADMPRNYCLLEDKSEVELNAAGEQDMMFKFLPQERSIKILQSGATIEEEKA
jgi:hypothetical protein